MSSNFESNSSLLLHCVPTIPSIFDDTLLLNSHSSVTCQDSIIQVHQELDDVLEEPPKPPVDPVPLRRSSKTVKQPSYLQTYHCIQVSSFFTANPLQSGTSHPLSSHVSYQHLSPFYKSLCCSISSTVEPSFYYQVVFDPKWQEAMAVELVALEPNNTWTLTPLPTGKKPIGCEWVYKIKYKANSSIER